MFLCRGKGSWSQFTVSTPSAKRVMHDSFIFTETGGGSVGRVQSCAVTSIHFCLADTLDFDIPTPSDIVPNDDPETYMSFRGEKGIWK